MGVFKDRTWRKELRADRLGRLARAEEGYGIVVTDAAWESPCSNFLEGAEWSKGRLLSGLESLQL